MNLVQNILEHNREFVENKGYEEFLTTKYPDKKMVIVTCMDTRLTELLPRALNLRNGDAKIIKNAGAIVLQPFGNIMRSIIVALYALNAEEVFVIGHHECGMTGLNSANIIEQAKNNGVSEDTITTIQNSGIQLSRWLTGFDSVYESVVNSVKIIRNHPLLPRTVPVHGMIIDPTTGQLDYVVNGYDHLPAK